MLNLKNKYMTTGDTLTGTPRIETGATLPQARSLGAVVLSDTIAAFHGGSDHFLSMHADKSGNPAGITSRIKTGKGNEVVGMGDTREAALTQALDAMRHLETVKTKANVYMPMTDDKQVLFTGIEYYAPKIAPGSPAYPVPEYLQELGLGAEQVEDSSAQTLKNTVETPDWDRQLVQLTHDFISSPAGTELAANLGIIALDTLTPEQAVKLSIAFVQSVSKYSYRNGAPDGSQADASTAMDLLRDGLANKREPEWQGNGVCRNVAANVKAVFDALKLNQTELSMLQNTYVTYTRGDKDDGSFAKGRKDDSHNGSFSMHREPGHAWNTFVTVDDTSSANITIIDATWALEHGAESAMKHMDYTTIRMAGLVRELAIKSDKKADAFVAVADYYNQLIRDTSLRYGITSQTTQATKEFAFTEFMKVAANNPELITSDYSGIVPRDLQATAYQLKDRLTSDEFKLLHQMSKADWINFDPIVGNYLKGDSIPTRHADQKVERLIVQDEELQEVILQKLGSEQALAMSEQSGRFRIRLRETHPEWLAEFDPHTNVADKQELVELARLAGFHHETDPDRLYKTTKDRISKFTNNQALFDAVTAGRSDYDLIKNFQKIRAAVYRLQNPQKQ